MCKRFAPDPVDRAHIEAMLAAAVRAPNHRLTEPWRFFVVTGAARAQLAALREEQMRAAGRWDEERIRRVAGELAQVPVWIVVACRQGRDPEETRENYAAVACAVQNMLLVAHGRGLGANWRTGQFLAYPPLRQWLGVAEDEELVAAVEVGYPAGPLPETPRTPWQEKTVWRE